jgi:hypothetical protein
MSHRIGLVGLRAIVLMIVAGGCLQAVLGLAAESDAAVRGLAEPILNEPTLNEPTLNEPIGAGVIESVPAESLPVPLAEPMPNGVVAGIPGRQFTEELWGWFPTDGWESSAEFGLNGATGNTESLTVQTGARLKRKTEWNAFELRLLQNRTQSAGLMSQNNVLLYGDFERSIGHSPWNWFVKQGLEYDELRAFDLRYFINSGLGFKWIEGDGLLFSTRVGAGASREFGGPDDRWTPEALLGATYEHQINPRNKIVAKVDYYPALDNLSDFRTITDMYWELLLSEKPNLSLKLGALHRHDSQPSGALPNDLNYSALMLYKF